MKACYQRAKRSCPERNSGHAGRFANVGIPERVIDYLDASSALS